MCYGQGDLPRLSTMKTRLRIRRGGSRVEQEKDLLTIIIATLFARLAGFILTPSLVVM